MRSATTALVGLLVATTAGGTLAAEPAPRAKPLRVVVLDFAVQGEAAKDLGRTLAEAAAHQVSAIGGYQVLTQAEAITQLGVEHLRQMTGCSEDRSCMAEIAGALDADRTMGGTVTQIGDGFHVAVSLIDARKALTIRGVRETLRNAGAEELLDAARRLAHQAVTGKPLETSGTIDFDVAEPEARVLLDGVEVGRGPLRRSRRVGEGTHKVIVTKEGFATWQTGVRVVPGQTSLVAPELVALPPQGGERLQANAVRGSGPYLEVRGGMDLLTRYKVQGAIGCTGTTQGSGCTSGDGSARFGWRLSPAWAVEGLVRYMDIKQKGGPNNASTLLTGRQAGLAVAWSPWESSGFALGTALELGASQTASGVAFDAVQEVKVIRVGPFAHLELRLDKGWGWFQLGLRAGLMALPTPAGVTATNGVTTYAIPAQTAVLGTLGLAARAWF